MFWPTENYCEQWTDLADWFSNSAAYYIVEKTISSIQINNKLIGKFSILTMAFHSVNHEIFVKKLS